MQPIHDGLAQALERTTLSIAGSSPGEIISKGDHGFQERLQEHYSPAESDATERLVQLKRRLRTTANSEFWQVLIQGITSMAGAQYGFVSKRIETEPDSKVAVPLLGEPGSCLLGVVFYWNDGGKMHNLVKDYQYWAAGAPCGGMKHDKVFLVPKGLPKLFPKNPNPLPFPAEAYIGIPLFLEGKCCGHFGLMWNEKGLKGLALSWAHIEALLHSLEDFILDHLLIVEVEKEKEPKPRKHMNRSSEMARTAQSLKPFARSLSHELRTPMQGVVGMLDVMHATVQESLEGLDSPSIRSLLDTLRENIEIVQGMLEQHSRSSPRPGCLQFLR